VFKTVGRWPGSERPTCSQLTCLIISCCKSCCIRSQSREVGFSILEVLLLFGSLNRLACLFGDVFSAHEFLVELISLVVRVLVVSAFRAFFALTKSSTASATSSATVVLSLTVVVVASSATTLTAASSSAVALKRLSDLSSVLFVLGFSLSKFSLNSLLVVFGGVLNLAGILLNINGLLGFDLLDLFLHFFGVKWRADTDEGVLLDDTEVDFHGDILGDVNGVLHVLLTLVLLLFASLNLAHFSIALLLG